MSDDVRSRLGPWDHWPRSPHTYLADERPLVWVEEAGNWYAGTLIGWTWDSKGEHWWGACDYHVGLVHHHRSLHQDRIRKRELDDDRRSRPADDPPADEGPV